ncbi:MAG TPA: hypothetical protein VMR33_16890 [Candidatus Baltobacteraceae bacterium]|jgi:hypothetical protein|nr:hypothetical protein [Candidatus Baltobacteraceae bacterium]
MSAENHAEMLYEKTAGAMGKIQDWRRRVQTGALTSNPEFPRG